MHQDVETFLREEHGEAVVGDDFILDDLPFHPWCWEIYARVSKARLGNVDAHGLWTWRAVSTYLDVSHPSLFLL
jgi:hypothetical protein